jgi:hypothetical protein
LENFILLKENILELDLSGLEAYNTWYAKKKKKRLRERTHQCRARMKEEATMSASQILEHVAAASSRVCKRQTQRLSTTFSHDIAVFAIQCLSGCSEEVQHTSFEKLLSHLLLRGMVPPHLRC